MPHRRAKQSCRPGEHRYRGKEHAGGCPLDSMPHFCVRCRFCTWRWVELMLFDPRPYAA